MSSSDWQSLKNHRTDILHGETAGLLHDWKKCMDWAVVSHWNKNPALTTKQQVWKQRKAQHGATVGELSGLLRAISLSVGTEHADLQTLANLGSDPTKAAVSGNALVALLGFCHGIAHAEKELSNQQEQLEANSDKMSTAFGYEYSEPDNLLSGFTSEVRPYLEKPTLLVESRADFQAAVRRCLAKAWGDTRRPINEVTLWDWSYTVASLYKSELARHFLLGGGWRKENDLRWRLLRINFDELALYSRAIKLGDLLGYRKIVNEACDQVKKLVEDEYPLGNEIYRDTTGIYFIFPDMDLHHTLRKEIRQQVERVDPELAPRICANPPVSASGPQKQLKRLLADQRSNAGKKLAVPVDPDNSCPRWNELWENLSGGAWEVCPVCRLWPKREEDEVCGHCDERRKSRVETWKANPKETIWLDELADKNGRIALIVGKFGLDDWLSGDLVQTLLVKCDPAKKSFRPKNASPARLRRVWDTCQHFWEVTVNGIFTDLPHRVRWELLPENPADVAKLEEGKVCDGKLNGKPISVFRMGNQILTVSHIPEEEQPQAGTLRVSWEGRKRREPEELAIAEARKAGQDLEKFETYSPTLTLLTSPDQFMALVPAADAINLASRIREEYCREFGKVKNRLPLFLGLVFFPRKTPLPAVMDTARRMLDQVKFQEKRWGVSEVQGDHVKFDNKFCWTVPMTMSDGTPDVWYPYFFVDGDPQCSRSFQFDSGDLKYNGRWLVHASELAGKAACVLPSRFAYIFLEHSGQRFEFDPQRNVMYLDELPLVTQMWEVIRKSAGMTDTRLRAVAQLFQAKGENWGWHSQEFDDLAETTLVRAGLWSRGKLETGGAVTPDDVTSGRFRKCLELYLKILKQRVKKEKEHDERQADTVTVRV